MTRETEVKYFTVSARVSDGWPTATVDNKHCKVLLSFNPKSRWIAGTNFPYFLKCKPL